MIESLSKLLDPYDRQARLYPSLLAVAPFAVVYVCLFGTDKIFTSTVISILVSCGLAYALGRLARDAGKRIQDGLFIGWGGAPTTQLLRHSNTVLDIHTKERYHAVLAKGLGKQLPSKDQESSDPAGADELYRAATIWLLGQTRDTKRFSLLFKENIAFGFHRNALGLRRVGIVISVLSLAWAVTQTGSSLQIYTASVLEMARHVSPSEFIAMGTSLVFLLIWTFMISEEALRRTGFAYATRLLESCDHLSAAGAAAKSPAKKKIT
jgi:hypothetical protein